MQVEPDLVNGPLPEFLRITAKYDTAKYISSKAVGAIENDDPEGELAPSQPSWQVKGGKKKQFKPCFTPEWFTEVKGQPD